MNNDAESSWRPNTAPVAEDTSARVAVNSGPPDTIHWMIVTRSQTPHPTVNTVPIVAKTARALGEVTRVI
jgi:hypothetical protein